jgi:hypothetical protein
MRLRQPWLKKVSNKVHPPWQASKRLAARCGPRGH